MSSNTTSSNNVNNREIVLIREVFVPVQETLKSYALGLLMVHFDEFGLERGSDERHGFLNQFLDLTKINHDVLSVERWTDMEITRNSRIMSDIFYGICAKLKTYVINAALFVHQSRQALAAAGGLRHNLARRLYQLPFLLLLRNLKLISIEGGYPNLLSNARAVMTCNALIPDGHYRAKELFYCRVFARLPTDVIRKCIIPFLSDSIKYEQALRYFMTVYRGLKLKVVTNQLIVADGVFNPISVIEEVYNIFWYRYQLVGFYQGGHAAQMGDLREYRLKIIRIYESENFGNGVVYQRQLLRQCQSTEDTMERLIEKSISDYEF